jgi:hypothetical protein
VSEGLILRMGSGWLGARLRSMNPFTTFLRLLLLLSVSASAAEFRIDVRIEGASQAEIFLKFDGGIATATVGGEVEQFNLKDQSWLSPTTGKWTTLDQCRAWAEHSKARSLKSVDAAPANVRPFALWSLNPTFEVAKTNDTLRLTSGQVDYVVEGVASRKGTEDFFRYSVLNAYKKAMTERKLAPFAELKALSEMGRLGHIPRKISTSIPWIPKAPKFEMEITEITP